MNRFARFLQVALTGEQRPDPESYGSAALSASIKEVEPQRFQTQREYLFRFEWRNKFFCADGDLDRAKRLVIQQFNHVIFGDTKAQILKIQQAIIEGDRRGALELLDQLEADLWG